MNTIKSLLGNKSNGLIEAIHDALMYEKRDEYENLLELAQSSNTYIFELRILEGIDYLKCGKYHFAYLSFCAALKIREQSDEVVALLLHTVQRINAPLALKLFEEAFKRFPGSLALWVEYWRQTEGDEPALRLDKLWRRLPLVINDIELNVVLSALQKIPNCPRYAGVINYSVVENSVSGWAFDFFESDAELKLKIIIDNQARFIQATEKEPRVLENSTKKLWRFHIKLPQDSSSMGVCFEDGADLINSPINRISKNQRHHRHKSKSKIVDILIPVYGCEEATFRCLESAISSRPHNKTKIEIIVLDDASKDIEFSHKLKSTCKKNNITYKRQSKNIGFTANINDGLSLHKDRDAILLNSDTWVSNNWVDRITHAAHHTAKVASVTPLSNFGELMSFPKIKYYNDLPSRELATKIDESLKCIDHSPIELPSGCGFCMYLNRDALNEVGFLDEINYSRGYGEETDWCLRASEHGWCHLGAYNVYVPHEGSRSFGIEKIGLAYLNNKIIENKYPYAKSEHLAFYHDIKFNFYRDELSRKLVDQLISDMIGKDGNIIIHDVLDQSCSEIASKIKIEINFEDGTIVARLNSNEIHHNFILDFKCDKINLSWLTLHSKDTNIFVSKTLDNLIDSNSQFLENKQNIKLLQILKPEGYSEIENIGNDQNYLIGDDYIDNDLGEKWISFLKSRLIEGSSSKFVLVNNNPWIYKLNLRSNVIYSPPPLDMSMFDHLRLINFSASIILECRINYLQKCNWRPYYLATSAEIPLMRNQPNTRLNNG